MKKLFLILVLMFVAVSVAQADWEVTASWAASAGPNLDHEDLLVGSTVIHTVSAGSTTAHVFTMPALAGETVTVISYNTQGTPNAGYVLGTLSADAPPAPASGGSIIIQWRP